MKKIPNDLKKYTDESVKAVNDAKAAIVRGKNITEQKTVDGYAAALEKAIAGLETETDDCAESSEDYQRSQSVRYAGQGAFLHRRF